MIRQLGPPTFFITFTSVDHLWDPLCNALQTFHSKHMKKTNENITEENIDSIIRKHPITCTCYYRNKFNALLKLLKNNDHFFGHVIDYFIGA